MKTKQLIRYLWLPLILSPVAWFYACSHTKMDAKINHEMQQEAPVEMGGGVAAASHEVIADADNLTQEQKDKLLTLHKNVAAEMVAYRQELGKLKMVLFRNLVSPNYDMREMERTKSRILKLDRKKTDRMLSALDEAQKILGRRSMDDEKYYRALMMDRIGMEVLP